MEPCTVVVVVTVYVPAHAPFRIGNGKVTELAVPDLMVNAGVLNSDWLPAAQFLPIGPETEKLTTTFWDAVMQSVTLAVIPISVGNLVLLIVDGFRVTAA